MITYGAVRNRTGGLSCFILEATRLLVYLAQTRVVPRNVLKKSTTRSPAIPHRLLNVIKCRNPFRYCGVTNFTTVKPSKWKRIKDGKCRYVKTSTTELEKTLIKLLWKIIFYVCKDWFHQVVLYNVIFNLKN